MIIAISITTSEHKNILASKFETNSYDINEKYSNISIITDTADIKFVISDSKKTTVVCYEQKNLIHSVSSKEGLLSIEVIDTRKWYEYIDINFINPTVTVYIPKGEYGNLTIKNNTGNIELPKSLKFENVDILENTGDVKNFANVSSEIKIKTSTGNIYMSDINANLINLKVSTGKIELSNIECANDIKADVSTGKTYLSSIKCKNLTSSGNTGNLYLSNVVAADAFLLRRTTGDINLSACDSNEMYITTDTGDVSGTILSEKVFITNTNTGDINVPKTINGGKCEITTSTGDIKIKIN